MSIFRLVEVSVASAQAAVNTATAAAGDPDAAVMRIGILEFLRVHASRVEAEGDDARLIGAYRGWLEIAVEVYSIGNEDLIPEYMRRAGLLSAELELAQARADGRLRATAPTATNV
jgi:hypothetical protein